MPDIYLVKYVSENQTLWWGESLNNDCANALMSLLAEDGAEPSLVQLTIPAEELISFASMRQVALASR